MVKGLREITAISLLLVANTFFGISEKQTTFIFPAFGKEVFSIISFYTGALAIIGIAFGLTLIYRYINKQSLDLPSVPPTFAVILNFTLFIFASYLLITWLATGDILNIPIPSTRNLIEQTIISANENTLAFIFLVSIFPVGTGAGNILRSPWNLITLGEYKLNFNPPNWNRFKYGFYAIVLVTLLHAGAYSYQVQSFNEFYIALFIAGILFAFLWFIKESFGFGACIATHVSWNLVLLSVRGAVY
jgi:hypothetical protein